MRVSASSLSECSPELAECGWVNLLGATVTNKNSSGHWMSVWQSSCCLFTLPTQTNTDLVPWETQTSPHQGVGLTAKPPTDTFVSLSISFLGDSNNPHCPKSKLCKINRNLDFLLILQRRWNSRSLSEMMTEDLSRPQHQGTAWGTEKLPSLYRWDSVMTVGTQHSVKLANSPWAAVPCPKSCPARPKRQNKNPAPFNQKTKPLWVVRALPE